MVVDLYKGATKLLLHTTKTTSRRVTVYLFAEVSKNRAVICIECFSSSAADSWLTKTREQQDKREEVSPRLHTTHLTAASALSLTLTVSLSPTPTSILFFLGGVIQFSIKFFNWSFFSVSVRSGLGTLTQFMVSGTSEMCWKKVSIWKTNQIWFITVYRVLPLDFLTHPLSFVILWYTITASSKKKKERFQDPQCSFILWYLIEHR